MFWNVTPYPGAMARRTNLSAEADRFIADGRGYLVEAPDMATARAIVRAHYFKSRGWPIAPECIDPEFRQHARTRPILYDPRARARIRA